MRVVVCGPSLQCGFQRAVRRSAFSSLVALLCLFALVGAAGAQESAKGLSKDQVVKLLKGGDPPARVRYLVSKYGIAFPLTPETEKELTQAGANQELLELVRKLAPPSPAVAAPSQPPPPPPPLLIINAKPGEAEVYVDDERHGQTSPEGVLKVNGLTAGSHKLRLSLAGYHSYEVSIELSVGQTNTVTANLQPVEPPPQPKEQPSATTPSAVKTDTSSAAPVAPQPKPPADPNDPLAPHDPGIYYIKPKGTQPRMVRLEPAPSSAPTTKVSTKGSMFGGMTGIGGRGGSGRVSSLILGPTAQLRVAELRPNFYFYFRANANAPAVSSSVFQTASSPTEFVLVRLESKKNQREIPTAGGSFAGGSASVRPKDALPFSYEEVAAGVYKVEPRGDVKPGEYGFLYGGNFAGVVPAGGGWLFDFGIDKVK